MEDWKIIELYWARKEEALRETEIKYEKFCFGIAWNILYNREDSEECVNDTWLAAWNAIPPERPSFFSGTSYPEFCDRLLQEEKCGKACGQAYGGYCRRIGKNRDNGVSFAGRQCFGKRSGKDH